MSDGGAPWVVSRVAPVGRLFAGRPDRNATSTKENFGTVWRGKADENLPLMVIFTRSPAAMAWVASSIAVTLPAVVVVTGTDDAAHTAMDRITAWAPAAGADAARIGVIGESDAAAAALEACIEPDAEDSAHPARTPSPGVARLALISPILSEPVAPAWREVDGLPPTLLQFSRTSAFAAAIVDLEVRLRATGVAVRAIDYGTLGDGWARYPKAVRGSRQGLDDLLGFLRRGFGVESTFHKIPGWDLH